MAKKKKGESQPKAVSPEKYMRTKVCNLPISACYVNDNWQELGIAHVLVIRAHKQGTFSFANFLVDTFCRGVYDSWYRVNVEEEYVDELIERIESEYDIKQIDYALAHNIIYGAVAFAEEGGIMPDKSFGLTQFILDEDTDDSPFMELEFGRKGKHLLIMSDKKEARKYINALDNTLGEGNYLVEIESHEENNSFFPFNKGVDGEYAYLHPEYPAESELKKLHYPQLPEMLAVPVEELDKGGLDQLMSLPSEELAHDLDLIIRVWIGKTWKRIPNRDDALEDIDYNVLPNALLLLAEVGGEKWIDTMFEVLRQNDDFIDFYYGDTLEDSMPFVGYKMAKGRLPEVVAFMKESGLEWFNRSILFDRYVSQCISQEPERRRELIAATEELFNYYYENQNDKHIWSGALVGLLIGVVEGLRATQLLPLIEKLYSTGKVDENCYGDIESVREALGNPDREPDAVPLDIHEWIDYYTRKWNPSNEE